jgi:hypothetical protein
MKHLALLLLFTFSTLAAPWDGTRGPFSLVTITCSGTAKLPAGLPSVPGVADSTWIAIRTADLKVTGVRLAIIYRDNGVEREMTLISDFNAYGFGGIRTAVLQEQIISVKLTELRDGESF